MTRRVTSAARAHRERPRRPAGRVELGVSPGRFLGPEPPVLILRERVQALQQDLGEARAFPNGQLQRFYEDAISYYENARSGLGQRVADEVERVIDDWIRSLTACP